MTEPIKLHRLNPHPANSEMWGELDVCNLVESIKETNRITPILVSHREDDSFVVLGGHRRLKAATELEWEEIDCEVHFGLTEQQEEDLMFLDNAANRIMDGDVRLKAALCLLRGKTGTQKEKIEKLAKLIGINFGAAKKVIQTAKSVNDSLNQIESKEERDIQESEVLRVAKKNGVRSSVVKKTTGANENKKSRGNTAKSSDSKRDTVPNSPAVSVPFVRQRSPESYQIHNETLKKQVQDLEDRLKIIYQSLPPNWPEVLQAIDEPIDPFVVRSAIDGKVSTEKKPLKVNCIDPPNFLHNQYEMTYKDQKVEMDALPERDDLPAQEEPDEDVIQDDHEEYATEETVEF